MSGFQIKKKQQLLDLFANELFVETPVNMWQSKILLMSNVCRLPSFPSPSLNERILFLLYFPNSTLKGLFLRKQILDFCDSGQELEWGK